MGRAAVRDGADYDIEHRLCRPNGEVRWVQERAVIDAMAMAARSAWWAPCKTSPSANPRRCRSEQRLAGGARCPAGHLGLARGIRHAELGHTHVCPLRHRAAGLQPRRRRVGEWATPNRERAVAELDLAVRTNQEFPRRFAWCGPAARCGIWRRTASCNAAQTELPRACSA